MEPITPLQSAHALVRQAAGARLIQAGVYPALHEADAEPDMAAGVSLGAVNAATRSRRQPPRGRRPRLRAFWSG
jgi:NTE family protein